MLVRKVSPQVRLKKYVKTHKIEYLDNYVNKNIG